MDLPESQTTPKLPQVQSLAVVTFPRKRDYPACPKCGLMFSKDLELKMHLDQEQWNEYIQEKHSGNLICEECCMFFETSKGFMQHIGKIHEKKYKYTKCQLCDKKFKNKYAVKFHMKQVHEKTTREKCPCCDKDIYNKYLLPKHLLKCTKNALRFR
jgi:uncharacterized C2H2 Zn-finger protein